MDWKEGTGRKKGDPLREREEFIFRDERREDAKDPMVLGCWAGRGLRDPSDTIEGLLLEKGKGQEAPQDPRRLSEGGGPCPEGTERRMGCRI